MERCSSGRLINLDGLTPELGTQKTGNQIGTDSIVNCILSKLGLFVVMFIDACSPCIKMTDHGTTTFTIKSKLIVITETWCAFTILDVELSILVARCFFSTNIIKKVEDASSAYVTQPMRCDCKIVYYFIGMLVKKILSLLKVAIKHIATCRHV